MHEIFQNLDTFRHKPVRKKGETKKTGDLMKRAKGRKFSIILHRRNIGEYLYKRRDREKRQKNELENLGKQLSYCSFDMCIYSHIDEKKEAPVFEKLLCPSKGNRQKCFYSLCWRQQKWNCTVFFLISFEVPSFWRIYTEIVHTIFRFWRILVSFIWWKKNSSYWNDW